MGTFPNFICHYFNEFIRVTNNIISRKILTLHHFLLGCHINDRPFLWSLSAFISIKTVHANFHKSLKNKTAGHSS